MDPTHPSRVTEATPRSRPTRRPPAERLPTSFHLCPSSPRPPSGGGSTTPASPRRPSFLPPRRPPVAGPSPKSRCTTPTGTDSSGGESPEDSVPLLPDPGPSDHHPPVGPVGSSPLTETDHGRERCGPSSRPASGPVSPSSGGSLLQEESWGWGPRHSGTDVGPSGCTSVSKREGVKGGCTVVKHHPSPDLEGTSSTCPHSGPPATRGPSPTVPQPVRPSDRTVGRFPGSSRSGDQFGRTSNPRGCQSQRGCTWGRSLPRDPRVSVRVDAGAGRVLQRKGHPRRNDEVFSPSGVSVRDCGWTEREGRGG